MKYEIEKTLKNLGRKFASANRGDEAEQKECIKKMSYLGITAKRIPATQGGKVSAEVHHNGEQPDSKEAHIEYWDVKNGQLKPNEWHGKMAHTEDADGDMIWDWASAGYVSTLNHVPEWLGTTVNGTVLDHI